MLIIRVIMLEEPLAAPLCHCSVLLTQVLAIVGLPLPFPLPSWLSRRGSTGTIGPMTPIRTVLGLVGDDNVCFCWTVFGVSICVPSSYLLISNAYTSHLTAGTISSIRLEGLFLFAQQVLVVQYFQLKCYSIEDQLFSKTQF